MALDRRIEKLERAVVPDMTDYAEFERRLRLVIDGMHSYPEAMLALENYICENAESVAPGEQVEARSPSLNDWGGLTKELREFWGSSRIR